MKYPPAGTNIKELTGIPGTQRKSDQHMKILTVIGARPQFIKAAALHRELRSVTDIHEILVHTGQHFDESMSGIFFEEMEIPSPPYNLGIHSLNHGTMTGRMLEAIENLIEKEEPALVLVYGDTNSTLAGALAAKKLHIPLGHVEAGLRSFNMDMPEEINRILTDRISDLLFCPTDAAVQNLYKEGFKHFNCEIIKTGDVMLDAALYYRQRSAERSDIIERLGLGNGEFILATLHREENTDNPQTLMQLVEALNRIAEEIRVVLPLHPRTRKKLEELKLKPDVSTTEPAGYFDMLELLKHCRLVATDSGGLQKEAYFFGKHCVTLRDQTEWIELVQHGVNVVAGTHADNIVDACHTLSKRDSDFTTDFYGNGMAAKRITSVIVNYLNSAYKKLLRT